MTEKQKIAIRRNWGKLQLMNTQIFLRKMVTISTVDEVIKITEVINQITTVLNEYDDNSIKLGVTVNAVCTKCKIHPTPNKSGICKHCNKNK